jgi:hypothetical protein
VSTDVSEEHIASIFTETSVDTQRITRRYILHNHRCEKLKSYVILFVGNTTATANPHMFCYIIPEWCKQFPSFVTAFLPHSHTLPPATHYQLRQLPPMQVELSRINHVTRIIKCGEWITKCSDPCTQSTNYRKLTLVTRFVTWQGPQSKLGKQIGIICSKEFKNGRDVAIVAIINLRFSRRSRHWSHCLWEDCVLGCNAV